MTREEIVMNLKKVALVLLMLLCLVLVLPLSGYEMFARASPSRTWTVASSGTADFRKIQDAINSENVSSGDTIFVRNGIYHENLVINKSLSLVAENVDTTIIYGLGTDNVVSVKTDNASFIGFTVANVNYTAGSGIFLQHSSGTVIRHNKIILSYVGIFLDLSNGNFFSDNIIASGGAYAIYLQSSSGNVFSGNNVSLSVFGISFSLSTGNTFFHNDFANNPQMIGDPTGNFWDYGDEGNYWSDYEGQDLNKDGLGDTPYNVTILDIYPLMGPFSDFEVFSGGETNNVSVVSNSTISDFTFEIGTETGNRIIRFKPIGTSDTIGFCRIAIPTQLMMYPYILLVGDEEATPTLIGPSNGTQVHLYFSYSHENNTVRIISSITLRLYAELLGNYSRLQTDFYALNLTYSELFNVYSVLLENYSELQRSFVALNESYQQIYSLNASYSELRDNYVVLQDDFVNLNISYAQLLDSYATLWTGLNSLTLNYSTLSDSYLTLRTDFYGLNVSYYALLNIHNILLDNYTQLQRSYNDLNNSYQDHLLNYSQQMQNIQSLLYIVIAIVTVFLITTVYLSRQAHKAAKPKTTGSDEE